MPRPPFGGAPRRPLRVLRRLVRGARLAVALVVTGAGGAVAQDPVSARFEQPVTRYGHAVLGAEGEYDTLAVTLSDGRVLRVHQRAPMVFEDVAPRLWDMDGDGVPEIVAVESHAQRGARLGFWQVRDGALEQVAATPHIGTRFRWLAPVGAADLDGDGQVEFAYVDRPHLAKILRVWRFGTDGAGRVHLTELAAAEGFSNHRIGWDYIEGGLRDCGRGPEMVLASGDWRRIMAVRFDGAITARGLGSYSPSGLSGALACR